MLKIALLLHGTEKKDKGGPSTRVKLLQDYLIEKNTKVKILHELNDSNIAEYDIIHVFNIWPLETSLQSISFAKKNKKKVVFSPIFLSNYYWPIYSKLISRISPFLDRNGVLMFNDVIKEYISIHEKEIKKHQGLKNYYETLCRCCFLADSIVFLSEKERKCVEQITGQLRNYYLIYNAVDDEIIYRTRKKSFKELYDLDNYILCVGRIETRKNQLMLAAISELLDCHIVLIGKIDDSNYARSLIKNKRSNLILIDHLDDKDLLASAYYNAICLVQPSWSEGASLVAIEAGMVGIPLILTVESSEQEYFGNFAKYVEPYNRKKIVELIEYCLANKESSIDKKKRSDFFVENFSFRMHAEKTFDVYRNLRDITSDKKIHTKRFPFFYIDTLSLCYAFLQCLLRTNLYGHINKTFYTSLFRAIFKIHTDLKSIDTND